MEFFGHLKNQEYELFTLRGLCNESDIDRGYFLMGGDSRDNNGHLTDNGLFNDGSLENYHMKPVYEGYFHTIHWMTKKQDSAWLMNYGKQTTTFIFCINININFSFNILLSYKQMLANQMFSEANNTMVIGSFQNVFITGKVTN